MHIEEIKYFLDLYDCGSYTETARRNYISQTAVSQFIHSLEQEFQVQLFDRSVTPVAATQAGNLFYREASVLWEQYAGMKEKMLNFRKNQAQTLRIAYASVVEIHVLLPFIRKLKEKYPGTELLLSKVRMKDISGHLLKNVCDAAICLDSAFAGCSGIRSVQLHSGFYRVLAGEGHPLFDAPQITMDELYRYPLIMLSREAIGGSYQIMLEKTRQAGYQPDIVKNVMDLETEIFSIITEKLIGFAPDIFPVHDFEGHLRLIPVMDFNHSYTLEAAYLKTNENPAVREFLEILTQD